MVERNGAGYRGHVRACSTETPDFSSSTMGELYAVRFPEELWDADTMPEWELPIEVDCLEPGCALKSDMLHALLGVDLPDPTGTWPESRKDTQLTYPDHDDDGSPGLTVDAVNSAPYSWPPVAVFPTVVRARQLMLGIRVTSMFDGTLDTCDRFEGKGPGTLVQTRAASCIQDSGDVCGSNDTFSTSQATFLDENLPKWTVESTNWTVVRLDDDADCADVRNAAY
ncbi:MAG: hypothetical protein QM778_09560 [Myxococcales bacterium]